MNVRYRVELSQAERGELTALLSGGKHAARKLKRTQILLAADAGAGDVDIAISVGVGGSTVYRTKRRFLVGNLEEALSEEPRPGAFRKLSGKEEALLIATACSNPPEGRARWTLALLADELGSIFCSSLYLILQTASFWRWPVHCRWWSGSDFFSLAIGMASRNVCTGVLPKHQRP